MKWHWGRRWLSAVRLLGALLWTSQVLWTGLLPNLYPLIGLQRRQLVNSSVDVLVHGVRVLVDRVALLPLDQKVATLRRNLGHVDVPRTVRVLMVQHLVRKRVSNRIVISPCIDDGLALITVVEAGCHSIVRVLILAVLVPHLFAGEGHLNVPCL